MFCSKCGKQLPEGVAFCGQCGAAVKAGAAQKPQPLQSGQPGVLWYQILLYGGILAMAVIGLICGLNLLTGNVYEGLLPGMRVMVYNTLKDLIVFDKLMGLLAMGLAGYGVYVWVRFRDRRRNAMKLFAFYLIGLIVWNVIYVTGLSGFVNNKVDQMVTLALRLIEEPVFKILINDLTPAIRQGLMSVVNAVLNFLLSGNYVAILGSAGILVYNHFYYKKHVNLFNQ